MNLLRRLRYLLPSRRAAEEREMREEFAALEEIAGRRELGNLTLAAENARRVVGWPLIEEIWRDLVYSVRVLLQRPGFAAVAVLSLGLGIGANAAIFSLIDTLLWRELPVREPARLVYYRSSSSYFAFEQFRDHGGDAFTALVATADADDRYLDTGGEPRRGRVEPVSGNYFADLGVSPVLGRLLAPDDDRRAEPAHAAVVSYRYWQTALGGGRDVLGRTIRVQRVPFTIVGVAPREFFGVRVGAAADVWVPLSLYSSIYPGRDWLNDVHDNFLTLVGRMRPGISVRQASAMLTPLYHDISIARAGGHLPPDVMKMVESETLDLEPAQKGISFLRQRFEDPLRVVFVMVAIGLLLACVNVAGLQYARMDERRRELSVRLAIGAGRPRVVRQLMVEALAIAACGAAVGLALCRPFATGLVSLIVQGGQPLRLDLAVDMRLAMFVAAVAIAVGLLCGLAPALRATRASLGDGLQQGSRTATAPRRQRFFGRAAAVVQLALSLVLVAASFLFAFSLRNLTRFDTGVDRANLWVVDVQAHEAGYEAARLAELDQRLLQRLAAVRGAQSVSYSSSGIYMGRNSEGQIETEFRPGTKGRQHSAVFDQVAPGYCAAIGARLLAGRDINERDNRAGPRVALVSQTFARHFFPNVDPVGRTMTFEFAKGPEVIQVVGVIADILNDVRQPPRRWFFLPHRQTQSDLFSTRFLVRGRVNAADLRAAVRAEDRNLAIDGIDSADALLNRTIDSDRLIAVLSFGFGGLAIVLAAVGIYGLLAYDVTRRTGEIGIRMALGATRGGVMAMVFREVAVLGVVGAMAGAGASLWMGRLVSKLVFGLTPTDPRVLAASVGLLGSVALAAAWRPARQAASLDPIVALRHD